MLDGLIAMCILAHTCDLHFPDLMDHTSIVAIVESRRHDKDRIQHLHKSLPATHQVHQSLYIMKYAPAVMPAIPFGEGVAPFKGIERGLEAAVLVLSPHELVFRIEEVTVVLAAFGIQF